METVFALDIGTRVVIGLIMQKVEKRYEIIASSRTEHTQRAMYDGQVHDVSEVASAVMKVKKDLEEQTGEELKRVAVAAAGRALCTEIATVIREEVLPISWERQDVLALEMEATQKAMNKVAAAENGSSSYYCVGYSTVKNLLEDQPISSLVGQRGKKAELSVIATFLPRTVVDGLVAVLGQAGLELASLTLEPIAAGLAAIPADMRRLNLALIDIGAGTSDIAITKDGTFFSYGMVPMAGDEVTEVICSEYLVDFQEGERIKKTLSNQEDVEIVNFFGEKVQVSRQEVLDIISPVVKNMAQRISQEILLLNDNKIPQALILVGGGGLTPLLSEALSELIGLPKNRIGIQVRERINGVYGAEKNIHGSDVITPIGIGMSALDSKGLHYYSVKVNEMQIPLFELQLATVAEVLLAAGIQPKSFLGRPGKALVYELDGKINVIKGELGSPAQITVNGKQANLDERLNPNDSITFKPAITGNNAQAQLKEVLAFSPSKKIIWNGIEEEFRQSVYLDGRLADIDEWLQDGCKVVVKDNSKLFDLLNAKDINLQRDNICEITINGSPKKFTRNILVKINGNEINTDCPLHNNDKIELTEEKILIKDLEVQPEPMSFIINGNEFLLPPQELRILWKGKELEPTASVENGMALRVEGFYRKPILSELFPYLNLTENAIKGGKLKMSVNGTPAEYTTVLNQGDRIKIVWEN